MSCIGQASNIITESYISTDIPSLEEAVIFKIDKQVLHTEVQSKSTLQLEIPISEEQFLKLDLEQTNIFSEDFILTSKSAHKEEVLDFKSAVFYTGKVSGYEKSLVSLQVRDSYISGIIRYKGRVYNLGKYKNTDNQIIYEKSNFKEDLSFNCEMIDGENLHSNLTEKSSNNCSTPVNVYIECDYQMYQNFNNNVTDVSDYITDVFNEVHTLYDNEDITVQISQISVWTSNDPYANNSGAIYDFKDELIANGFNGDVAHLVTNDPGNNGGIAYVDQLCGSYPFAYSDINNSYNPYPTYSWDVEVFAHEMGHNFGSSHTHSCVWGPNGDEQIDDCGNVAQGQGGSCYDPNNPIIPSSGGTIMSYCHTQSVGIDFTQGFGTEPGDLIRQKHSSCFCDNSTCNTASEITTDGTYFAHPNNGNGASNSNASHADWFSFTPSTNGHIDIESCYQGIDTRLWVWTGTCANLTYMTYSDDDCTSSGQSNYASQILAYQVTAGITYYIEWDNRWSSASFDWEFAFTSDGGGNPCQDYLSVDGAIMDSTYHANMIIDSDGSLNNGNNAMFKAGQGIELNAGFEIQLGSTFETRIEPCTN